METADSHASSESRFPALQKRHIVLLEARWRRPCYCRSLCRRSLATSTNEAAVDRFFDILEALSIKDPCRVNKFLERRIELEGNVEYTIDRKDAFGGLLSTNELADANSTRAATGVYSYDAHPDDADA